MYYQNFAGQEVGIDFQKTKHICCGVVHFYAIITFVTYVYLIFKWAQAHTFAFTLHGAHVIPMVVSIFFSSVSPRSAEDPHISIKIHLSVMRSISYHAALSLELHVVCYQPYIANGLVELKDTAR